jgi:hypothetical protein
LNDSIQVVVREHVYLEEHVAWLTMLHIFISRQDKYYLAEYKWYSCGKTDSIKSTVEPAPNYSTTFIV